MPYHSGGFALWHPRQKLVLRQKYYLMIFVHQALRQSKFSAVHMCRHVCQCRYRLQHRARYDVPKNARLSPRRGLYAPVARQSEKQLGRACRPTVGPTRRRHPRPWRYPTGRTRPLHIYHTHERARSEWASGKGGVRKTRNNKYTLKYCSSLRSGWELWRPCLLVGLRYYHIIYILLCRVAVHAQSLEEFMRCELPTCALAT